VSKSVDELKPESKTKILVSLPESIAKRVKHVAVERGKDVGDIVTELIRDSYPGEFVYQNAISA